MGNLRGKFDGLPGNLLANAEGLWFVSSRSKYLHAVDVRESVNLKGKASGLWLHELVAGKQVGFSNWTKIQHIPSFGIHNQLHVPVCGEVDLALFRLLNLIIINKIAPHTTQVFM